MIVSARRRQKQLEYGRRWAGRAHARIQIDLRALKLLRGCLDCGYDANPDALEFDHVRGIKRKNVNKFGASLGGMLDEIAKCDVVCANCHSIRTAKRRRERLMEAS